jgi:hypothetical protein
MGDVVDFFLFVIIALLTARFVRSRVESSKAPKYLSKKRLKQAVIGSASQWLAQLRPSYAPRVQVPNLPRRQFSDNRPTSINMSG